LAVGCRLGVDDDPRAALQRLARFSHVAQRLPRLPRLEPRALRTIIAGMMKDLSTVSTAREELGLPREEWSRLVERCGRLLNEVGRAVATLEALSAAGAPGPHEEALRRLAALLAADPCLEELRRLAEAAGQAAEKG
jgi:hypothetical protein